MSEAAAAVVVPQTLPPADLWALNEAWRRLEQPSFAARASSLLGTPLEAGLRRLPTELRVRLERVTERALDRAFDVAVAGLAPEPRPSPARRRAMTVGLGAAGGFFGPAGLVVELPVTTIVMLQTIADIARLEGEDMRDLDTRLACLQVFALGSPSPEDDAAESGFFQLRTVLATQLSTTALPMGLGNAIMGVPRGSAFVQAIARRFGVVVGQKAAARAVPVIGAATGASLNALFFEHYLAVARGHFALRRLERHYGRLLVAEEYARIGREHGRRAN